MSVSPQEPWTIRRVEEFTEELVAAYRDLVAGHTISATARLRELLPVYAAELLPDINQRIVACHALINRGLRDEALGRASDAPNLILVANTLDLDRFGTDNVSRWKEASKAVGLVWPAPLRFDLLGRLVEAKYEVDELKPLLDTWRSLNIGRAPLPQRLTVLRQLAKREPSIPVWRELLVSHEKHRFAEIKAAFVRLNDRLATASCPDDEQIDDEVRSLLEELRVPWTSERPPGELILSGEQLEAHAREQRVDRTLDRLPGDMESAAAALADASRAEREALRERVKVLAQQWHDAMRQRGAIAADDPRLKRATPVLDYVHRLTESEHLMLEVSHGISDVPSQHRQRQSWAHRLEQMMDRIDEAVSELPDADIDIDRIAALSDRVARIAVEVRREARVRSIALAAMSAAAVVAAAVVTWWSFDMHRHQMMVAETVSAIATINEEIRRGDQRDITEVGRDWPERIRRDPRVSTALSRMQDEDRAQADRRGELQSLLGELDETITSLKQTTRDDPLTPWPPSFSDASRLLDRLTSGALAVTDRDRALAAGPTAALRVLATGYTQAADTSFVKQVKQLETQITDTEAMLPEDLARADVVIADIQKRVESLVSLTSTLACPGAAAPYGTVRLVSPTAAVAVTQRSKVMQQLATLRARRDIYAGLEAREQKADELLAQQDFPSYADMLREIANDIRGSAVARDYEDVAKDHTAWKALAEWASLLPRLRSARGAGSDEASLLRKLLDSLPEEANELDFVRSSKTWLDPLLARAEEFSDERLEKAEASLHELFRGRYGTEIDAVAWEKMFPEPRPVHYFLLTDRPLPDKPHGKPYLVAWPNKGAWQKKNWLFDPATHVVEDAPQKVIASRCLALVDQMPKKEATGWAVDMFVFELLKCCAESRPPLQPGGVAIDPCLHALLLRWVMLDLCDLSSFAAARLQASKRLVEAGFAANGEPIQIKGADNLAFKLILDPATQHSEAVILAARKACITFLETVRREVKAAGDQLAREEASLKQHHASLIGYTCMGRLRRFPGGRWSVSGGVSTARQNRTLYVVRKSRSPLAMVECVICDENGAIPAGAAVDGRAGDPVYLKTTTGEDL